MSRPALLALLLIALVAPAQAHAGENNCRPEGSKTLANNSGVRVFKLDGNFFGCRFATNRAYPLWVRKDTKRLRHIRIEGSYVAYAYYAESPTCDWWRVGARSMNLRNGSRGRRVPSVGCGDIKRYKITDVTVKRNGSLGIIRLNEDLEDGNEFSNHQVIKADSSGVGTVDSQGFGYYEEEDPDSIEFIPNPNRIIPDSLTKSGNRLIWDRASGEQTAPFS